MSRAKIGRNISPSIYSAIFSSVYTLPIILIITIITIISINALCIQRSGTNPLERVRRQIYIRMCVCVYVYKLHKALTRSAFGTVASIASRGEQPRSPAEEIGQSETLFRAK